MLQEIGFWYTYSFNILPKYASEGEGHVNLVEKDNESLLK
jgi:hypothetical protein